MRDRILQLEALARQLDPESAGRRDLTAVVTEHADRFLNALPEARTYVKDEGGPAHSRMGIGEQAADIGELLEVLGEEVETTGINPAAGGHFGYVPGGGVYPAALGDFLADVSNRYSGVFFASPGAVRLEKSLVRWLAGIVGFPGDCGGDLTSGGSVANLSALVTAREACGVRARDVPETVVYLTAQAHHCIDKALRIAGLDECVRRIVPMDERHRMNAAALETLIDTDKSAGLAPWLVIASAGTTDTGAVDPMAAIADIARRHDLWFHVDAAYGGFFVLCESGREILTGMDRADSLVMDPHKGLFLPFGSGAVLVRSERQLAAAHAYQASYMQDAAAAAGTLTSPADLSPELSRPFRGLRMWLPLKLFGLAPFRAALEEKIQLARYFYEELGRIPGFEPGPYPDLSIVTYRYVPEQADADACNRELLAAIHADGKVFASSTILDGRFTLRLAALHFRSHLEQVDYMLDLLKRKAAEMSGR